MRVLGIDLPERISDELSEFFESLHYYYEEGNFSSFLNSDSVYSVVCIADCRNLLAFERLVERRVKLPKVIIIGSVTCNGVVRVSKLPNSFNLTGLRDHFCRRNLQTFLRRI